MPAALGREMPMRRFKTAWILLALFLVAIGVSTAYTMGDETVVVGGDHRR